MATPTAPAILDKALLELPAPPRRARTAGVVVMAVTALCAAALAWSMRGEAHYALRDSRPVDLGALSNAPLGEHAGELVRGTVALDADKSIELRRPLEEGHARIAPAKDVPDFWVEYQVPATLDGPRFLPPRLVSGRLVRTADLGVTHRGVKSKLGPGLLLIEGEDPISLQWVLGLEITLLLVIVWNLYAIGRVLRPVRA